jgi:hypothetical protein
MEDRAPVVSPSVSQQSVSQQSLSPQSVSQPSASSKHHEGRGAWVLTAYGVSGLALFGVLAYFFSDFIAH